MSLSYSKIGKNWWRMADIYRRFAIDCKDADFSDSAALAFYRYETFGISLPKADRLNGFELGKKWMDITIAMWKEDIATLGVSVKELQEDYPDWFLERVGILNLKPNRMACDWWINTPRQQCTELLFDLIKQHQNHSTTDV